MIKQKYETQADKEAERQMSERFVEAYAKDFWVKEMPFLSAFDYLVMMENTPQAWLEVKRKSGEFTGNEMIPYNKVMFMKKTPLDCFMLIEKGREGRIYNIKEIDKKGDLDFKNIKRREDQPGGSTKVFVFDCKDCVSRYKIKLDGNILNI